MSRRPDTSVAHRFVLSLRARRTLHGGALAAASVAVVALLVLGLVGRPMTGLDEPLLLVGSRLLGQGQRVHVDFHSVYLPLNYQLTSWVFALLGETAVSGRLLHGALYLVGLVALGAWYYRRGVRHARWWGLVLGAALLCAPVPGLASCSAFTCSLLAVLLYLGAIDEGSSGRRRCALLGAGACAGLALCMRVNFGAYLMVLPVVDLLSRLVGPGRASRSCAKAWSWDFLAFSAPVIGCGLLMVAAYQVPLAEAVRQTVAAPSGAFRDYALPAYEVELVGLRSVKTRLWLLLPAFPLAWLAFRCRSVRGRWVWTAVLFALLSAQLWLGKDRPSAFGWVVLAVPVVVFANQCTPARLPRVEFVALFGMAMFLHYYGFRPDPPHHAPALALIAPLLPLLRCSLAEDDGQSSASPLPLSAFLVLVALPGLDNVGRMVHGHAAVGARALAQGLAVGSDSERVALAALPLAGPLANVFPRADELLAVQFVQARTGAAEPVFVGLSDHRRPHLNEVRVSWLLGRPPGTRHIMLMSGFVDSARAQRQMQEDLERRGVRWVLLETEPRPPDAAFLRRVAAGSALLDDALERRYRPVFRAGAYEVRELVPARP